MLRLRSADASLRSARHLWIESQTTRWSHGLDWPPCCQWSSVFERPFAGKNFKNLSPGFKALLPFSFPKREATRKRTSPGNHKTAWLEDNLPYNCAVENRFSTMNQKAMRTMCLQSGAVSNIRDRY
jgi:hypothetical protein